jgi:hypothetical protein
VARWTTNFTAPIAAYDSGQYLGWGQAFTAMTIVAAPGTSTAETAMTVSVADDAVSTFRVMNFTATDATFAAALWGKNASTSYAAINIIGEVTTDSGSQPAGVFDGRASGALSTRPLFDFRNYGTSKLKIWYDGGITQADGSFIATGTTTGMKIGTSATQKLGFWNKAPVVQPAAYTQTYSTATRTFAAYTADDESGAYTTTGAGADIASKTDLNALRVAYENLRAHAENIGKLTNSLIDDSQSTGMCA